MKVQWHIMWQCYNSFCCSGQDEFFFTLVNTAAISYTLCFSFTLSSLKSLNLKISYSDHKDHPNPETVLYKYFIKIVAGHKNTPFHYLLVGSSFEVTHGNPAAKAKLINKIEINKIAL